MRMYTICIILRCKRLCKLADDTSLLVPSNSVISLADEFNNVKKWAREKRMINNMQKTKEIVFHRPSPKKICLPSTVDTDSIEQVASAKLLRVILHECLSFNEHVRYVTAICAQRVYFLKRLRDQGLPVNQLNIVFEFSQSIGLDMLYRPGEALLLLSCVGQSMLFFGEPLDTAFVISFCL